MCGVTVPPSNPRRSTGKFADGGTAKLEALYACVDLYLWLARRLPWSFSEKAVIEAETVASELLDRISASMDSRRGARTRTQLHAFQLQEPSDFDLVEELLAEEAAPVHNFVLSRARRRAQIASALNEARGALDRQKDLDGWMADRYFSNHEDAAEGDPDRL